MQKKSLETADLADDLAQEILPMLYNKDSATVAGALAILTAIWLNTKHSDIRETLFDEWIHCVNVCAESMADDLK